MATEPTTWVSLPRIKQEIRLSQEATDQDDMLVNHIDAAIRFIEMKVGIPLFDKTEIRTVQGMAGDFPMDIGFVSFLQGVPRIDYWDQATLNQAPDGKVEQTFETQAMPGTDPNSWVKCWQLLPPTNGFPESATGEYRVTIQSGMNPSDFPNVQAILIAMVRESYTGGGGGNPDDPKSYSNPLILRMIQPLHGLAVPDRGAYTPI